MTKWHQLTRDGKVYAVIEAWKAGNKTASFIGAYVGTTKNAVIGVYGRNAIALANFPLSGNPGRKIADRARAIAKARGNPDLIQQKKKTYVKAVPLQETPADLIGPVKGISILDLTDRHCRWPVHGEREHTRFCGEPVTIGKGKVYCACHHALAHIPRIAKSGQSVKHAGWRAF